MDTAGRDREGEGNRGSEAGERLETEMAAIHGF